MRCRECAAEVAVTSRVCSRCGAPIVGQPPVVDTVVADMVVGAVSDTAVSDAAGKQSLSEVRLALWLKARMLVPGETVNVYGGSGDASELLISSPSGEGRS
jgi:hypothetical protein